MGKRKLTRRMIRNRGKTLSDMTNVEIQDLINQLEYRRLNFPKSTNSRMIDMREQYTKRITFLRSFLDSRKNGGKK